MITIKKISWAGGVCPYQIEAVTDDDKYFYLRYRNGVLRYGIWDSEEECDHTNYLFTKTIGGKYDGCADQEAFDREMADLVKFPDGFRHDQTTTTIPDNYPEEGCWSPKEQIAVETLNKLFDSGSLPS